MTANLRDVRPPPTRVEEPGLGTDGRDVAPARLARMPDAVLALQATAGNRAVVGVLRAQPPPHVCGCQVGQMLLRRGPDPAGAAPKVPDPAGATPGAQREPHHSVTDPLYLAKRRFQGGQMPGDAIYGTNLVNWAIARGGGEIRKPAAIKRLQENPSAMSSVLDEVYKLLVDRLWGTAADPETGVPEPDEFEGSENARGRAVFELSDRWPTLEGYFRQTLINLFQDSLAEAIAFTPKGATLVTDSEEIKRLRTPGRRWNHKRRTERVGDTISVGERRGTRWFVDIYQPMQDLTEPPERRVEGSGLVWFSLEGHPLWYYEQGGDMSGYDPTVAEVAKSVHESTQFAAMLFPLMLKGAAIGAGVVGGFAPTLAARIAVEIGSITLDEIGEEGSLQAKGQKGRSAMEIVESAGLQFVIGRVFEGAFTGVSKLTPGSSLGRFELKAAQKVRAAVVQSDAPAVARGLREGHAGPVTDPHLRSEGFHTEVHVVVDGQPHIYRQRTNGKWCRWSTVPMCQLDLPAEVARVQDKQLITRNVGESTEDWLKRTRPDYDKLSQAERERAVREADREHDAWMAPRASETPEDWLKRTRNDWDQLGEAERRKALREAQTKMDLAGRKAKLQEQLAEKRETLDAIYGDLNAANKAKEAKGRLDPAEQAKLADERRELLGEVGDVAGKRDKLMKELEGLDVTPYDLARAYSYSDKAAIDVTKRATVVDKNLRKVHLADEYSGKEVVEPSIDHIVPVEEIAKMKGYDKLKPEDWKAVLSRTDNLRMMEKVRNSSKGARRWEDWPAGRRLYGDEVYEKMVALERELREKIEQDILKRAGLTR